MTVRRIKGTLTGSSCSICSVKNIVRWHERVCLIAWRALLVSIKSERCMSSITKPLVTVELWASKRTPVSNIYDNDVS